MYYPGVDTKPPANLHDSGDLNVMVTGSGSQVSKQCRPLIGQITAILSSDWLIISPGHTSDSLRVRVCGPWSSSGPLGGRPRPRHQLRLRRLPWPGLQHRSLAPALPRVPGPGLRGLRHDNIPGLSLQLTGRQVRRIEECLLLLSEPISKPQSKCK